jgi:hypothetical protein
MQQINQALQTVTENLAPVPQESQLLPPSSNEFKQAISQTRISQDYSNVASALQYAMMLVGIRGQNAPTQAEFDFLKYYLIKNFGSHTAAEIRIAFDLAVSDRLELGESGAKCYENFSCEYVGRIMSAYREWAKQQHSALPNEPPAGLLEFRMPRMDWSEEWEYVKESAKNGNIDRAIIPVMLYEWLVDNRILVLTGEDKKRFFVAARAAIIREIVDCGNLTYEQKKDLEILRSDEWYKNDLVKSKLQNKSKILAVKWLACE